MEQSREPNDCVPVSIANGFDVAYDDVFEWIRSQDPTFPRKGCDLSVAIRAVREFGRNVSFVPVPGPRSTGVMMVRRRGHLRHLVALRDGAVVNVDGHSYSVDGYLRLKSYQVKWCGIVP